MSNPWNKPFEDLRSSLTEEEKKPQENVVKKVRQAVYDIRYRARREDIPLAKAFSQYMANSGLGPQIKSLVRAKLGEELELDLDFIEEEKKKGDKYKVRVKDAASDKSYVRYASREKIEQLRKNPQISSVEMTDHGEPYEGKYKKSGKNTVGDADGDGTKEDNSHEYAGVKDRAIKKAIATRKESYSNWRQDFENFFFESTIEEKVLPSSPYVDVMPEKKNDSAFGSTLPGEKGNNRLRPKSAYQVKTEEVQSIIEELGGELLDLHEAIPLAIGAGALALRAAPHVIRAIRAARAAQTLSKGSRATSAVSKIIKSPRVVAKSTPKPTTPKPTHRPGQKPSTPKPTTAPKPPKTPGPKPGPGKPSTPTTPKSPPKPGTKPQPHRPGQKPQKTPGQPKPSPSKPSPSKPSPGRKPSPIPTKPQPQPQVQPQVQPQPQKLKLPVKTAVGSGLVGTATAVGTSLMDKLKKKIGTPPPAGRRGPGGGPIRSGGRLPLPKIPKLEEPNRSIGIDVARKLT